MHTSGSADRATMGHVTQTPVPGPAFRDVPDGPGVVGPRRNRVTPLGDIVAAPLRGAWCGNRGNLHDRGTDVVRFHDGKLWIVCALEYRNRRLEQWAPGRYTLLFFHDEAVAFAAGHRPCALCRRTDYQRYRDGWAATHASRKRS